MSTSPDIFSGAAETAQRGRNFRLGWFVAGAVLIAVAAVFFMLVQKGMFKRTAQLYFFADSAKGMSSGMAVKLNGFKIGTLDKLVMDTDGRVSGGMLVGEEYVHLIHKDAKALWAKEDMLGESVIEIVSGSGTVPTVENNAVIAFERSGDVTAELSKLTKQLQPILADVKNITAYVDNPDSDLKKTLQQMNRATTALASAGEDVSEMTRTNKKQIHAAISSASNTLSNLDSALPPLIIRIDSSLKQVEGVTTDARTISSKLVTEVPSAVSEGRAAVSEGRALMGVGRNTLDDTHQILNGVKESWPIRNLLPAQDEHSLPLDSHVPPNR